jgi:hypothetical protein
MTSAGSLHPQVDVNYDEMRKIIKAGEYRPALSDQELDPMDFISDIWKRPLPGEYIHVFVGLPSKVDSQIVVYADGECFIDLFALAQDI